MSASSSSTAETAAKERSEATASHAQALNSSTTSESIKGPREQSDLVQGNYVTQI